MLSLELFKNQSKTINIIAFDWFGNNFYILINMFYISVINLILNVLSIFIDKICK